jgi:hypothetical protein
MKSRLYKTLITAVLVATLPIGAARAQGGVEELLRAGDDASKLIEGYTKPVLISLAMGVNQGWYNTAKPHKSLGFDFTVTVSAIVVPESDLFYQPSTLGLQTVELVSPSDGNAPTVFGPAVTPVYRYTAAPGVTFSGLPGLNPPKAFGERIMPAAVYNLGIGIIKDTDIRLRLLPKTEFGDKNYARLFGIGIMHDVKQYIPGIKALPFDLSVFGAFTKFEAQVNLEGTFASNGTEQLGQYSINAWTVQALISKKISVLTFYGGVGYNSGSTAMDVTGSYDIGATPIGNLTLVDPVSIDLRESSFRSTLGMRLKLGVLTLHGDYTIQKRKVFSTGVGISFR